MPSSLAFSLSRQDSLAVQKFSKNHVQKSVHCVAKNIPFALQVSSTTIDLSDKATKLSAKLYYDADDDQDFKMVDYVKQEPMSYRIFQDSSDVSTLEFRLFVLSSQHEDSNFRIKVGVSTPDLEEALEVVSEPIRVVSKASQVNKDKKKRTSAIVSDNAPISHTSPPSTPVSNFTAERGTKRKTDSSDLVLETLQRLEQQQREQRQIIELMLQQQQQNISRVPQPTVDFETAFNTFLAAYSALPAEDRPNKVRKVLCASNAPEKAENLSEFILLAASAEPIVDNSKVPLSISQLLEDTSFNSLTDGASRNELDALDDIYTGLTWTPESDV